MSDNDQWGGPRPGERAADPTRPDLSAQGEAAATSVREALEQALGSIRSPADAEQAVERVLGAARGVSVGQLRQRAGAPPAAAAARKVEQAARPTAGAPGERAGMALNEAASQIARGDQETREAVEQGAQEALNPAQRGAAEATAEQRDWLLSAVVARMGPLQKLDARLFLAINRLPHTPQSNWLMYALTTLMNFGGGWGLFLLGAATLDGRRGMRALHSVLPPLWLATLSVEYPIKHYFRRTRPFIDVVQAVAVGRKPGTYSFPSGHSAAAFAGAWLLSRHYPALRPLWYLIAGLVGFSRVYLGVHYPGDVLSGAVTGTTIAEAARWMIDGAAEHPDDHPVARLIRRTVTRDK